ncbi:efflux RND transporter periplasmic adaptor subunit [Marinimicrobium sp. C2-29]|uniref:efflux RND transporter periplasmic adaptor subunit n=1 Tax=Marinimicrobium sp. C2-29 TaxID=3139825 RepID=UPI0031389013
MNKSLSIGALLCALVLGAGAGIGLSLWYLSDSGSADNSGESSEAGEDGDKGEPLYWVAPMDDSYRRDEPGQSPMGMDLVPVYAGDEDDEPGDVRIEPTVEQNLGLKLGDVTRGDWSQPVETVGLVQVNQDRIKHYHVRATGWVSDLSVATEGDPVRAGQKLFEFYSPEIVNIQQEYLQGIRQDQPERARSSLSQLRAKGVSEREVERLKETREVREKLHYYSERDGYAVQLGVREGNFVDLAQNLMSIGSLDDIWLTVEVFERQAGLLAEGQPVTVTSDSYPGEEWQGEVDYLYPSLNADNRTLRARLVFPNEDGKLKPDMFVRARVDTGERNNVISAPASAVIRTGRGARVVKQVEPNRYRSVPVRIGHARDGRVEILEGLSAGDRVVVDGQFLIDSESSREAELLRMEPQEKQSPEEQQAEAMDHSEMDQGDMDHSEMDHGEMDHEDMEHENQGGDR